MSYARSRRQTSPPATRPSAARATLATIATGALVAGAAAFTPMAASAATAGTITDAVFEWGLSKEAGGGAFFGGCNFLSAGIAGDTGSSRLWTQADGFYRSSEGNVSILKDGPDGTRVTPEWSTKCQTGAGTAVSAANTASTTGNVVQISGGVGSASADGSFQIEWDGDFSVVFYGGLTYWSASDPVLTVDADGNGRVTATASGYGTSMEDMSQWVAIAPEQIVLADLTGVEASDTGFTITPDYLGVEVETGAGTVQNRTAATWGAFPQSYVDFNGKTGQSSYWYSSGGARDAAKPATPLTVSYAIADAPAFSTSPASKTVTTADSVTLTSVAVGADAYQWQSAAVGSDAWSDIAGATSADYSFVASTATARQYRVIATGTGGAVTSAAATVTVDVPTPTVTVSKTTGLDASGETVTVSGTGFLPNAPLTSGSRPPLAGQFTGAYIALASRNADGSGLANYTNGLSDHTTWAVRQENLPAIGGAGAVIAADGTFTVQILATDFPLDDGKEWGIRTYAAGGAAYPAFATFTPLQFAVASGAPAITSAAVVGRAVTGAAGEWADGTTLSYQWLRSGTPIDGATALTYTPVAADAGTQLSLRVSGARAGYTTVVKTTDAVTVAAGTLSTAVPTVSGTAKVGAKLTASAGSWTSGASVAFQWLRDDAVIPGATSASYTAVAADAGKRLSVRATGSLAGYTSASTTSAAVTVAAGTLSTAVPTVSGTAKVGAKLTASAGSWTSGTSVAFQWLRDGAVIPGATSASYTAVAADAGKRLSVRATGSLAGYTNASTTSATVTVAKGTLKAATPKISGTAKVGKKLTAKPGSWTAGTKVTYQWYVSGKAVKGATKSTYTPKAADRGKTVKVRVAGALAGYTSVAKVSAVKKVAAGTLKAATPKISGTAKVGKKLTAVKGSWTAGTKVTYQWYVSGKAVKGATKSTYTVKRADRGTSIVVKAKGVKAGYSTVTKTSKAKKVAR